MGALKKKKKHLVKQKKRLLHRPSKTSSTVRNRQDLIWDVYEEEDVLQPTKEWNPQRFDAIDVYEFDLPSDFEDEEIDENLAFNDEDENRYGEFFSSKQQEESAMKDAEEGKGKKKRLKHSTKISNNVSKDEMDQLFLEENGSEEDTENAIFEESEDDIEEDEKKDHADLSQLLYSDNDHNRQLNQKHPLQTIDCSNHTQVYKDEKEDELELEDLIVSTQSIGGAHKKLNRLLIRDKKATLKRSPATLMDLSGPLPVPLSKNIQDRLHREAAFKETSKDISKWVPVVKKNREAEHLRFPLNESKPVIMSNATLTAQFKADTEFEKQMDEALTASGMKRKTNEMGFEETGLKSMMGPEEMVQHKIELEKTRAYLFFHEQRMKRVAKIKSKKFRKLLKKEKERAQNASPSQLSLKKQHPESIKELILKTERDYAKERMSLKNCHRLSRLRRDLSMNKNAIVSDDDDEEEEEVKEIDNSHLSPGNSDQMLKDRTIKELHFNEHDDDMISNSEYHVESTVSMDLADETHPSSNLWDNSSIKESLDIPLPTKGLFSMKFMQRAIERQRKEAKSKLIQLEQELQGSSDMTHDTTKVLTRGRRIFGSIQHSNHPEEKRRHDDLYNDSHDTMSQEEDNEDDENVLSLAPQLRDSDEKHPLSNHDKKKASHVQEKTKLMRVMAPITISESNAIKSTHTKQTLSILKDIAKTQPPSSSSMVISPILKPFSGTHSKHEGLFQNEEEDPLCMESASNPISQKDLIKRAFAHDNVIEEDFEQEKVDLIDAELPKTEFLALPGWGRWIGDGLKNPPYLLAKQPDPNVLKQLIKKRKDAHLKHVIIQEKQNKKLSSLMIDQVPFPFETCDQYNQSIRNPLGFEWNTQTAFQRLIKPHVTTQLGHVIDPIKFSRKELDQVKRQKRHHPFSITSKHNPL
jgi:U3 small nucleolar RNA-associated protein 14